jgi:hypothetical protein
MAHRASRFTVLAAFTLAAALLPAARQAAAQGPGVTLPPDGGNQPSTVTQAIGLVRVSIDYSSPHVHTAAGDDRRGKIWGSGPGFLVQYGPTDLGFGTCAPQCPWRGGANQNTVFTTSHDILVQGQPLAAGTYGLHFIPDPNEWTVVFSKNHTSWGSFFYDPKEDALRVKAKPAKGDYHEDLTYWFRDRKLDHATAVLSWEDVEVPFAISVADANELYFENISHELRSSPGFRWQGWTTAANFSLQNKIHLDVGLRWAEHAVDPAQGGQANFTTLSTLADLQEANGKTAEAKTTRDKALRDPTAGPVDLHLYARQLLRDKHPQEAMAVFELNAKLHPNVWPVHLGLARGYDALGRHKEALAECKLALPQAPDEANRNSIKTMIKNLEEGKSL